MGDVRSVYCAAVEPFAGDFDPQLLMSAAERVTGLSDWGGDAFSDARFRERLTAFCSDMESAAALTDLGRSRAHSRLHVLLASRLRQIEARKESPPMEVLPAPLVGMGLPRAGTTFLHGLLAQDPGNLVATAAQAAIPVPAPASSELSEEDRVAIYDEILTYQGFTAPDVTEIHPYAAAQPEECVFLQEAICGSPIGAFYYAPSFNALCAQPEHVDDGYAWQKGVMETLQTGQDARRWLLKAPLHIARMDGLHNHFPDALVFVNHRDPGKVIPSMASLYMKLYSLGSDNAVDPVVLGPQLLANWKRMLDNFDAWRAAHPEVKTVDVQYSELISDPIGEAERLYDAFGLELAGAAKDVMSAHLKVDHHGKGPKRSYTLAEFGLTEDDIEDAYSDYIERHHVRREARK